MRWFFVHNEPTDDVCVRDLEIGMTVPVGTEKTATILHITTMDGANGEPPLLIGGGGRPSAVAIKVEFLDHPALIAHPGDVVKRRQLVKLN